MTKTCAVEGCEKAAKSRGWCPAHYMRWRANGDPGAAPVRALRSKAEPCDVEDCSEARWAGGLCHKHYDNKRRRGDALLDGPGRGAGPKRTSSRLEKGPCSVEGCAQAVTGYMTYCGMHQARLQRRGSVGGPEREMAVFGQARRLNKEGYVVISGGKLEHRVMWEQANRPLLPGETVHHKNGVRDDNRLDNFELWVSFQPAGQRPEDLLVWADEIIRRYR